MVPSNPSPLEAPLRLWKVFVGSALVLGLFIGDTAISAHPPSDAEAALYRGPGPQLRARAERAARYLSDGHPAEAVEASERLLVELRAELDKPSGDFTRETVEAVARDLLSIRNAALQAQAPIGKGKNGAFLASILDAATWSDWSAGVPTAVTLGQAILESNWGKSARGNNLFGLKGTGTAGSVKGSVVEYKGGKRFRKSDGFRAYNDVDESIQDHARLLSTSKRYKKAQAVNEDPAAYVKALQGIYATDPRYAQKLSDMMRRMDLHRFNVPSSVPYR